jgi:excisionase family DNA binding protein
MIDESYVFKPAAEAAATWNQRRVLEVVRTLDLFRGNRKEIISEVVVLLVLALMMTHEEKLLTVQQVADMLTVTNHWVRAHANGNRLPKLPSVKLGSQRRFKPEAIDEFIRRQSEE